jgi:hypothetical protein
MEVNIMIGEEEGSGWKKFLRNHWTVVPILAVAAIAALVGAIRVYLWFVGEAQTSGLVPKTLGSWSMGHLVMFFIYMIFWELLFIGIPAVMGAVAGWLWWRKLPEEERQQYHFNRRRSRRSRGGRWMSPLFFIAFCIKVYIDGNGMSPFRPGHWTMSRSPRSRSWSGAFFSSEYRPS